jgi:hypothetical protein
MKTTGHADERTFRRYNKGLSEDQYRDVTRIFDAPEPNIKYWESA